MKCKMDDKNFKEKIKSLSTFLKEKGYEFVSVGETEKDFILNCKRWQDYEYVTFDNNRLIYTDKNFKLEDLVLFYIQKDFLFNFKKEVTVILPLNTTSYMFSGFRISTKKGSFVLDEI